MSSDELTSPEDPEWVDAIVRRALERAAAEPAAALDTAEPGASPPSEPPSLAGGPVNPPPLAPPPLADTAPSIAAPSPSPAAESAPLIADPPLPAPSAEPPGRSAAPRGDQPAAVPLARGDAMMDQRADPATMAAYPAAANGRGSGPVSAYPFDPDDLAEGVDEELFDDALALDETHDAAISSRMRSFLEWGAVIVGALAVALLIKTFLMQAYFIPSSSMETTLEISDRVLVNKLSYAVGDVSRGDLIVFGRPATQPEGEPDLIKRVIALGGETIQFRDGAVFIREPGGTEYQLLVEPYLDEGVTTRDFPAGPLPPNCIAESDDTRACTIPEGHLFMMGDNRGGSSDSRDFGPIDEETVVGRAFLRVWPLGRLGFL
ncbi:MAG: signal peptidase I [Acidimicrobiales bacterium]